MYRTFCYNKLQITHLYILYITLTDIKRQKYPLYQKQLQITELLHA